MEAPSPSAVLNTPTKLTAQVSHHNYTVMVIEFIKTIKSVIEGWRISSRRIGQEYTNYKQITWLGTVTGKYDTSSSPGRIHILIFSQISKSPTSE